MNGAYKATAAGGNQSFLPNQGEGEGGSSCPHAAQCRGSKAAIFQLL